MNDLIKTDYLNNGFVISKPLMDEDSIKTLREDLDNEFKDYNDGVSINITDFKNFEVTKKIIQALNSSEVKNIIKDLQKISKKKVSLLPILEVHKNYHVNLKEFHGWHRDAGGEMQHKYCNKILGRDNYLFSKIGIYLQNNSEYGGSIDIVQKSHKNFSYLKIFLRKIKNIPLRAIMLFHKYLTKFYFFIPESFFMFLINAKRLYPQKGSAVFFDSRLIHRGSPISKNKLGEIKYIKGKLQAVLPKSNDKYSIYCQFGSTDAVDSYMHDRLKRKGNSKELSIWFKQIKIIETFDKELSDEMAQTLNPIKEKYKEYLD